MTAQFEKIFVAYPRGVRTGGPEALHQLVDELRAQGEHAFLVPLAATKEAERVPEFRVYDAPEAEFEDRPGNAFIVPETGLRHLWSVKQAQTIIWWLSFDYGTPFLLRQEEFDRRFKRMLGVRHEPWAGSFAATMLRRALVAAPYDRVMRRSLHLSQSYYARAALHSVTGLLSTIVSDYIPRPETGSAPRSGDRGRTVAFNPAKAPWVPELLGPRLPDVQWRALAGLSRSGVEEMLGETTVYFDPGYHPGRDRMPREAARLGAVTVVARRGAGAYWDDVPVTDDYKVAATSDFVERAAEAIGRVLDDPASAQDDQEPYRRWIEGDRGRFQAEVRRGFIEGRWGDDGPTPVGR